MAWDVLSGMAKNGIGCFVQGGKSLRDVLSGMSKMAGDVLSRDVLSYIPIDIQSEFWNPYATSCYAIFVRPFVLIASVSSSFGESPTQFENRIMARVYARALHLVLCTKKLNFVSRN